VGEVLAQVGDRTALERAGIFPSRVIDVQDRIGDGTVVELAQRSAKVYVIGREIVEQLERPLADCPCAFERQVAFVAEAELKDAAVILAAAGSDGLGSGGSAGAVGCVSSPYTRSFATASCVSS
jgi:hypothetical protein